MHTVFGEGERLLSRGEPFVLATVVRTKGSTPQKPGAKLIVRRDGSIAGTLGGGCVEADVWAVARRALENDEGARLGRFVLDEDIAANDGLVCGGTMEVLIEPIVGRPELLGRFREILAAYEGGGDRALATRIAPGTDGEPDTVAVRCAALFMRDDGTMEGTLGSRFLDNLALEVAREEMPRGRDRWMETEDGTRVYIETFTTPATLVIAGAGHVGKALYTVAEFLGFRTVIVDDRPQFANRDRFPHADRIVVDDFDRGLRGLGMGSNHFVVVATRGHKLDDLALLEAARSGAGYIGLLGSRRKAVMIFRDLIRKGIPEERIRGIRAPVGLELGGRQPEEIAVSILSEVLAVRHGRRGTPMTLADTVLRQAKRLAARRGSHGA